MSAATLEHVNLTVTDPLKTAQLLCDVFGWHIRWQGAAMDNGYTVHVGNDAQYIALYASANHPKPAGAFAKGVPLNHVAMVVDDLAATEQKVVAAGLVPFSHGDYAPGRRFYFFDSDGIEYEIVSYA